jgi:hypothetical protein
MKDRRSDGPPTGHLPQFQPTHHHRGAGELAIDGLCARAMEDELATKRHKSHKTVVPSASFAFIRGYT